MLGGARNRRWTAGRVAALAAGLVVVLALAILGVAEGPRLADHVFASRQPHAPIDPARLPPDIADLPVVVKGDSARAVRLAVFVTGGGGWQPLDKRVSEELIRQGYLVAALDAVSYFDRRRSPERLGRDISRVVKAFRQTRGLGQAVLIGYSFGADVLPFAYGAMKPAERAEVAAEVLLSPSHTADFWLGTGTLLTWLGITERPTLPATQAMGDLPVLCYYGADNADESLCPSLTGKGATVRRLDGGHHFDGDFHALGRKVADDLAAVLGTVVARETPAS